MIGILDTSIHDEKTCTHMPLWGTYGLKFRLQAGIEYVMDCFWKYCIRNNNNSKQNVAYFGLLQLVFLGIDSQPQVIL